MPDYSLVPVDYQPDFDGYSLVPLDHDPFSGEDATQQAQTQAAQPQPQSPLQQPATGVSQPNVGAPANNAQIADSGESWDPDSENGDAHRPDQPNNPPAAPIPSSDRAARRPFDELRPATFTPTQQIGYLAADGLMGLGMQPYTANDLTRRVGNLLGLTPLGIAGSALDLIDAKRRGDLTGAAVAAAGMIPGAKGVVRGAREVALKDLRLLHSPETIGSRPDLARLSDEELLESVINPMKKDPIKIDTDTGKLADGNSRILELQTRAANPASSITPDTRVPVAPHTKDQSAFDVP